MSSTEEVLILWHLFKQGDWDAYTKLYNAHFALLTNYGYKFTPKTSLIEDAIQDLFIDLWTNKTRLGNPLSVKNYLYKALRNNLFRKLQAQARFTELPDDAAIPFEVSFEQQLVLLEQEQEVRDQVKAVLGTLPPRQQEILFLRFYEGFGYPEIADIMGITVASTYKLLYKALHSMQGLLRP